MDKAQFLGMLTSKVDKKRPAAEAAAADDSDDEEGKKGDWGVLKDDYMLGDKNKNADWDDGDDDGDASSEQASEIDDVDSE